MMMRLDNGEESQNVLLVDPKAEWKQGDGEIDRKYRILWKKPEKRESTVSLWDDPERRGQEPPPGGGKNAPSSWDQVPEKEERPEGW
jgi:hypothetical protein